MFVISLRPANVPSEDVCARAERMLNARRRAPQNQPELPVVYRECP